MNDKELIERLVLEKNDKELIERMVLEKNDKKLIDLLATQPDSELVKLLKDDAYAMTFQSIGQYRSALIKAAGGQQCD